MTLLISQAAGAAGAVDPLPGIWEQFDDKTGKLQALVRIVQTPAGEYEGFIDQLFVEEDEDPNPRCELCSDERKNQPVVGMRIIEGLKREAPTVFSSGRILDPDSGDSYRLNITVINAGNRLEVRGFIGISLFGRTQIWRKHAGPATHF